MRPRRSRARRRATGGRLPRVLTFCALARVTGRNGRRAWIPSCLRAPAETSDFDRARSRKDWRGARGMQVLVSVESLFENRTQGVPCLAADRQRGERGRG